MNSSRASHRTSWVLGLVTAFALGAASAAEGQLTLAADAAAPKGFARRWEAAVGVGLYGQCNIKIGRVTTILPITSFSGRGPAVSFALYHNMNSGWGAPGVLAGDINGDDVIDDNDIDPFIDLLLQTSWSGHDLKLA